jgi:hypothetical protein
MPTLHGFDYIVEWLSVIGPVMPDSSGIYPLNYQEIESWQRQTGTELTPWEVETLRRLSCEYVNYIKTYSGEKVPCPDFDLSKLDKKQLARQIQLVMRGS